MEENINLVPEFETISRPPNALDLEPSAPGVEPVVSPQRIVSTDKKALKAGGLQVVLKGGAPVSPADEADVNKTYELIPLNA